MADIFKKDGVLQARYAYTIETLVNDCKEQKEAKYYLKYWSKSKGKFKLIDTEYDRMIDVLNYFGIAYERGNDGKKGGLEKDYIIVKFDGRKPAIKKFKEMSPDDISGITKDFQ